MKLNNISIAMKVIIPSSVSLILVIFTALWAYSLSDKVRSLVEVDGITLASTVHQMDKDVIQVQQWFTDISATSGRDGLNDGFLQAEKSYRSLLTGLSILEVQYKKNNDEKHLAEVQAIRQKLEVFYLSGKEMANVYIEQGSLQGNKKMRLFDDQAGELSSLLKPFVDQHFNIMLGDIENMSDAVLSLMKGELIVFILIACSIITGAFLVLRMVMSNMQKSQMVIERLTRGELVGDLEIEAGKDEMGKMMGSLGDLYKRLQVIVGEVNKSSEQIRDSAGVISHDSENLSVLTSMQEQALHETSHSMKSITESLQSNAENAQRASNLANEATEVAREGALAITNTIGSMGQVDASSKKISEITSVIDGIAFQTNLLALNASVEAARAGEEGRGFAVVANEVRSLAQRSAGAAKEIKALIEESVERVDAFSQQVDASGEALAEIVGAVRRVSEVVDEIAKANHEQSTSVSEVDMVIRDMNSMTKENNGVAIEVADFSRKLKEQADYLSKLMNFFKIA